MTRAATLGQQPTPHSGARRWTAKKASTPATDRAANPGRGEVRQGRGCADMPQGRERSPPDVLWPRPRARGGRGTASRTVGLLGAIFAYAAHGGVKDAA
jgi:hypothetical protein